MSRKNYWRGIYPALVTPFNEDGSIDRKGTERLISFMEEGGLEGVYALGTTGEFPHLDQQERFDFAEMISKMASKLKVIVNIGDISTQKTVENAKRLNGLEGIHAVATISPYYYSLTQEQLVKHHTEVARSTELPFFFYYIPQMTKIKVSMNSLKEIASMPNFAGVKDSSHDINWYGDASKILEDKAYLTGSDALIYHFLRAGSDGAVAATACASPRLLQDLIEAYDAGKDEEAIELQEIVCRLRLLIKRYSSLAGFKAILEYQGICKRFMRSPLSGVSDEEMLEIERIINEDEGLSKYIRRG